MRWLCRPRVDWVAVTGNTGGQVLLLGTKTGRVVRIDSNLGKRPERLYWLGAERSYGQLVAEGSACWWDCGFEQCGTALGVLGEGYSSWVYGGVYAVLREGVVILDAAGEWADPDTTWLHLLGAVDKEVVLPRMPADVPFDVVGDVAHSRVFSISASGLVAEIDRIRGLGPDAYPRVRYHEVGLNGRPFEAGMGGRRQDRAVGRGRAWHDRHPHLDGPRDRGRREARDHDALRHRRVDGQPGRWSDRLQARGERTVPCTPRQTGQDRHSGRRRHPYADTDAHTRYSINLRTGKVMRTLRPDAKILAPDIVAIP